MIRVFLLFVNLLTCSQAFNFGVYSVRPMHKDLDALLKTKPKDLTSGMHDEFNKAHSWCSQHRLNPHCSILSVCKTSPESNPESIDYLVLFRQNHEIFTVSGLVRLQQETPLSTSDVFLLLRKFSDTSGYLQLHELKTWCTLGPALAGLVPADSEDGADVARDLSAGTPVVFNRASALIGFAAAACVLLSYLSELRAGPGLSKQRF